ncbi:MAG: dihydroxy-acid dehydratase, partial [Propionibacteriaceae bacterium]|nr:dihydroxy-acid dehydratase [Propionibacteriaceae bacterium]
LIEISIPDRSMTLLVDDTTLAERRARQDELGWRPRNRDRVVSKALEVYAAMALSADKGAARSIEQVTEPAQRPEPHPIG